MTCGRIPMGHTFDLPLPSRQTPCAFNRFDGIGEMELEEVSSTMERDQKGSYIYTGFVICIYRLITTPCMNKDLFQRPTAVYCQKALELIREVPPE